MNSIKLFTKILVMLVITLQNLMAQTPSGMSYQGVARDMEGNELRNTPVSVSATITVGGMSFSELHSVVTDDFGVFTVTLGGGQELIDLPWNAGNAIMSIEVSSAAGTVNGSSPINSVPYAFLSGKAESLTDDAEIDPSQIGSSDAGIGQVLKWDGSKWSPANDEVGQGGSGSNPTGPAGGDLSGIYPNPTAARIQGRLVSPSAPTNGQVLKWNGNAWTPADDETGTGGGSPTGPAGGDLTGNYPNPNIANNAITSAKIVDNAIITEKLANGVVTGQKIAQQGAINGQVLKWNGIAWFPADDEVGSGGGSPTGPAGGDLSGTYPNPFIANEAITTEKISDAAVSTPKLSDNAVSTDKLANNAVSTIKIENNAVNTSKIADDAITTPKIVNNSVTIAKLPTGASGTTFLRGDGTWTLPSGGTPGGTAGGDLGGNYPNPTVSGIQGRNVSNTQPNSGDVLKWSTSTGWTPQVDAGLVLPFSGTVNVSQPAFSVIQENASNAAIASQNGAFTAELCGKGFSGDFSGDFRVNGNTQFNGASNVNGIFTVTGANSAIDITATNTGSRLNLKNNGGGEWSMVNVSNANLTFQKDNSNIVTIVYPTGFLNPASLRPSINNELSLGSNSFRWTTVYATNGTINTSDRNLKKNMLDIEYGLSEILRLKPVSYQWIDNIDNYKTHLGFIAQEVEEVIPEVITVGDEGDYGMNYAELVPVLVKSIQELTEKIVSLESKLTVLEAKSE